MNSDFSKYLNQNFKNKVSEFDKFKPLLQIEMGRFKFTSSRFELWRQQELINSNKANININTTVLVNDKINLTILKVEILNSIVERFINTQCVFNFFITQNERIMLLNLPQTEAEDSPSLIGIRSIVSMMGLGANIPQDQKPYLLNQNQPYCCSLYFKDKKLIKVTFLINKPESLLELYNY